MKNKPSLGVINGGTPEIQSVDPFNGKLKCPKHNQWVKTVKLNGVRHRTCSLCDLEDMKQRAKEPTNTNIKIGKI